MLVISNRSLTFFVLHLTCFTPWPRLHRGWVPDPCGPISWIIITIQTGDTKIESMAMAISFAFCVIVEYPFYAGDFVSILQTVTSRVIMSKLDCPETDSSSLSLGSSVQCKNAWVWLTFPETCCLPSMIRWHVLDASRPPLRGYRLG